MTSSFLIRKEDFTLTTKKVGLKIHDSMAAIRMYLVESHNFNDFKEKSNSILLSYKNLTAEQKNYCCKFATDLIFAKYKNHEKFTNYLHSYLVLTSHEKTCFYTLQLYESLIAEEKSFHLIKKISETLIEITNEEFDNDKINEDLLAHCLTLLIEISIRCHNLKEINKYDRTQLESIVDYISSNIIAMCNINNIEIRIAAVILLHKISGKNNYNLQKILSRFGQSLLEHIFSKYFTDKETKGIAFTFLSEHFDIFLTGSPYLAEMTNSVLQTQMLKHDKKFIQFLGEYINIIQNNLDLLKSFSIHLAFLLRRRCDLNKPELINEIIVLIFKTLEIIQNKTEIYFVESFENVIDILSKDHSKNIRETINKITKYYLENTNKSGQQQLHKKTIDINSKRIKKNSKNDELDNHFAEIFLLAK